MAFQSQVLSRPHCTGFPEGQTGGYFFVHPTASNRMSFLGFDLIKRFKDLSFGWRAAIEGKAAEMGEAASLAGWRPWRG